MHAKVLAGHVLKGRYPLDPDPDDDPDAPASDGRIWAFLDKLDNCQAVYEAICAAVTTLYEAHKSSQDEGT
jgi:hypothetical protein